ncbi:MULTISPECIES: DUF305 domain-containing protein [unclassified Gordonia (in: high G+C Gram-positive bacteria)]|uniref:DUF305 domain-containing protein n=1 Tax=unclassified Gordonia (in: high G+C Gram-positive bacteria) TaxID=2657482 RepID=UPI001F110881|nr:DUF305 domain-containing protein [Gordonia sp. ABSL49_1]MCH5644361.1 DUF305 domain-containing protein [Gordonia sp. ABSL49_1]
MTESPESHDDATTVAAEPESAEAAEPASRSRLLLALAGVAILLVGVGLGLVIQASFADDASTEDRPAADSAAVGFAQDMSAHHQQGVEMASIIYRTGEDIQVRSLAYDILTTQSNEIGQMQSWLTRWGYPLDNPGEHMAWMGHDMGGMSEDGHHHDHGDMSGMPMPSGTPAPAATDQPMMPGMATQAEMAKLYSLRGAEADTYFLQLMLRHHEGGTPMMQYAANPENVDEDYVRSLATSMINTQGNEINTIKTMLAQRNAQPLPMN